MNTFFIVGVQRSGTTLLSVMLGKHPDILMEKRSIVFRIITCFKNLYDLLPFNIQHPKDEFLQWLIENDKQGRLADLIDLDAIAEHRNIRSLIQHSIDKKLKQHNKQLWGDKSPNLQHYLNDLTLLMPDTKIIHIIRDGRANAYSMSRRSYQHLSLSAQYWVDGNIEGFVNQQILGEDRYKIIYYEQLLQNPEAEMKLVCQFLNLPYSSEMLALADELTSSDKSYVKNFFDTQKINTWKQALTNNQIKQVEAIQRPLLEKLNYALVNPVKYQPLSLTRRILYNQMDNFKQLFRSKRIGMKNREKVLLRISLKNRLKIFIKTIVSDFFSRPIFKTLFSQLFYTQKYFRK